jgi:tRNA A37 threonylcarbamoyltransferase TsaD
MDCGPVAIDGQERLWRSVANILSELADSRAERVGMTVPRAIVQRLDATFSGLTTEVRAVHGQIAR